MQEEQLSDTVKEAMSRIVKEKLEEFGNANPKAVKDFIGSLLVITDLEPLLTQTANEFPWDFAVKQELLECDYVSHLYDRIVYYLMREIEILMIKRDYQGKVKEHIDKNQRDYILREELKVIREELGDDAGAEDADGYLEQLEKLRGCQVHTSVMLSEVDIKTFKRLGIELTSEPVYEHTRLYQ